MLRRSWLLTFSPVLRQPQALPFGEVENCHRITLTTQVLNAFVLLLARRDPLAQSLAIAPFVSPAACAFATPGNAFLCSQGIALVLQTEPVRLAEI